MSEINITPDITGAGEANSAMPLPLVEPVHPINATVEAPKPDPNCPVCHGTGVETMRVNANVCAVRACPKCFPQGA
jgi:hypothetical protein